jgi:hypothetical protein
MTTSTKKVGIKHRAEAFAIWNNLFPMIYFWRFLLAILFFDLESFASTSFGGIA